MENAAHRCASFRPPPPPPYEGGEDVVRRPVARDEHLWDFSADSPIADTSGVVWSGIGDEAWAAVARMRFRPAVGIYITWARGPQRTEFARMSIYGICGASTRVVQTPLAPLTKGGKARCEVRLRADEHLWCST